MNLRRLSLVTLLAFGCATVRVPVGSAGAPEDALGAVAAPVVELWLESSEDVPEDVAERADADAREALASALAAHPVRKDAMGANDAVLFTRERAVGLTDARRSQQTWAKVGIVAGVVVVVAAIVGLAVTRGKGGSPAAAQASKATTPKAVPVAVKPRAAPTRPVAPAPIAYGRPYYGPSFPIFIGFQFWIPPRPLLLDPEPEPAPWDPEPPPPLLPDAAIVASAEAPPPPPDAGEIPGVSMELPPLADEVNFPVEDRGFFAGPHTAVQLDLVDRATGRVLWSRAVSADEDPRDAPAMAKIVGEALAGQRWAQR